VGSDPPSESLIKPFARGREIGRWACYPNEQWILVIASSANRTWPWSHAESELAAERKFAETYPAIHEHLKQRERALRARSDQGTFWWELRSCDYYDAFARPKILVGDMAWRSEFAFDDGELHVGNTIYVVPTADRYVLGILNSRLMWWYFYNTAQPAKDDARRFMGVLGDLPIPQAAEPIRNEITKCASSLFELKRREGNNRRKQLNLELRLNGLVERAFQLNPVEQHLVTETLPPRDPIVLIESELQGVESATPAIEVPLMPEVIPSLDPAQETAVCVWALLHAAGGSIPRADLARAFVLRSQPALLKRLAPSDLQALALAWSARVGTRNIGAGSLAEAVKVLSNRDGLKLMTDASGASLFTTSAHTPPEDQIDEWFRFEARLALRVLAAVSPARVQDVEAAIPDADRVVLRAGVA
jgi:hypothetical protein